MFDISEVGDLILNCIWGWGRERTDSSTGATAVEAASGRKSDIDLHPEDARRYRDAAELSMDVYNDQGAPEGSTRLSDAQIRALGLDPDDFRNDAIGFYAALYRNDETGEYTLAFRGSDDPLDWVTNVGQAMGVLPEAYLQAASLTASVRERLGPGVMLTGHSLGGGLANYAAVACDMDFTIFNAAGLSEDVIDHLGDRVENYTGNGVVINDEYDPLTNSGGGYNDETWGGRHVGASLLIFVDSDDYDGGRPWQLLDPDRRKDAHRIDNNILAYLNREAMDLA